MRRSIQLALAGVLLLAGCVGTAPDEAGSSTSEAVPSNASFEPANYTFEDEFALGGPQQSHTYEFEVPNGTTEVMGLLTWSIPGASLNFQLVGPAGEVQADGWAESDQHRYVTTTETPQPGTWTAVVTAERGVDVHYTLEVEAREGQPYGAINRTYTVPAQDFAEINLNMQPNRSFTFDWQASGELYFNVHYHADGETRYPIEHNGTELSGNFTAPRTQTYSLLFSNEGATNVDVTVSVDGTYRLHSMTRDEAPERG